MEEQNCQKIFFPNNIIIYINYCTNQQLNLIHPSYARGESPPTNFKEMLAFFELLYLTGVKKAQHLNTNELWFTDGTDGLYGIFSFHIVHVSDRRYTANNVRS